MYWRDKPCCCSDHAVVIANLALGRGRLLLNISLVENHKYFAQIYLRSIFVASPVLCSQKPAAGDRDLGGGMDSVAWWSNIYPGVRSMGVSAAYNTTAQLNGSRRRVPTSLQPQSGRASRLAITSSLSKPYF